MHQSIYNIAINDINRKTIDMSNFKGKKLLIVNVASECGLTDQYVPLEELSRQFRDTLVIIGCPCNDFGGQEPGENNEIAIFCERTYGVSFLLTEKIGIKHQMHPLYVWLTTKEKNGVSDNEVEWNFHKFLINEDGSLFKSLPSITDPLSDTILKWITKSDV